MYHELINLLSRMCPVNAALALALFLNKEDPRMIFLAVASPDKEPSWVQILARGDMENYLWICKEARAELMKETHWCWLDIAMEIEA